MLTLSFHRTSAFMSITANSFEDGETGTACIFPHGNSNFFLYIVCFLTAEMQLVFISHFILHYSRELLLLAGLKRRYSQR